MTRYVIVGAGAIGVSLAAELSRAGRDVLLVGRGAQLEALRAGRMTYVRPDGRWTVDVPTAAGPGEVDLVSGDVLVLATKTQDAESTIAEWAWREVRLPDGGRGPAAAHVPVVTPQNGLDAERVALRRFATVFGAVLGIPATYLRTGEVLSAGTPQAGLVWIGQVPGGGHPLLEELAADLRAARFAVRTVPDIARWKAGKLLVSVTFVVKALYPDGPLRDRAAAVLAAEAREILAAAGQDAADLVADSTADFAGFTVEAVPGAEPGGNSTWQSLTRAGSLETDFLNGEIVLTARLLGRSAPASEAVLHRIHRLRQEGAAPGSLTEADLLADLPVLAEHLTDAAPPKAAPDVPRPAATGPQPR